MGRIAQSLIETFRQESQELSQAAGQFTEGLDELPGAEELADEGYDPQHALYIATHNFTSMFAESACQLDEFQEFAEAYEKAEDEYMPSGPPMSPITGSFFGTWAMFDFRFGADQETVGSCLLELMRSMQAPDTMLTSLQKYSDSRMGIYLHCGRRRGRVVLRELVTGEELLGHSSSGYKGRKNELWYVRLAPPVNDEFDYHIAVTTPYVLTEASAEDWTAFLNKHLLNAEDKRQALHELLKFGNERVNWMEFVFQAYHHAQVEAIFLAGIPDVAASLPHSPTHDETEEDGNTNADDEFVRIKFSEAQRKAIASMCPELALRMRLPEPHQRNIELRRSEFDRIIAEAEKELPTTKGPRRNTLKKIIQLVQPPTHRAPVKTQKAPAAYQLKITLAGSKPPIWRMIETQDCTLSELHYLIQGAMGWTNSHLHEFNIAGERYAEPLPHDMGPMDDLDAIDSTTIRLSDLTGQKKKFRCEYLYDFGDNWEHVIELKAITAAKPRLRYPRCTDGARACPPEDCGGIWGFHDFVEAITDRKHPEHAEMMDWHGPFKPATFNKDRATREMRQWLP